MPRKRRLAFLFIFALLVLDTGWQAQILMPKTSPTFVWLGIIALFWTMLGGATLSRLKPKLSAASWVLWLTRLGSFIMGIWSSFIILSLFLDAGFLLKSLVSRNWMGPPTSMIIFLLEFSFVLGFLGLQKALAGPQDHHVDIPVDGLPPDMEGLRIVQISDFHIGSSIDRNYVKKVVSHVLDLKPDLIAITGDLADGTPDQLKDAISPLAHLTAPMGVFYVTGNHEYYWGAEAWIQKIRELGFTPLINENRILTRGTARLLIGGVCDTHAAFFVPTHFSDPQLAAISNQPCDYKILLAHRPDACFEAEKAGFQLQLSGHTHGGQFFPFSLLIGFFHRYVRGLNRCGKMWVYVHVGTGYWGPPHRLLVPAEISILRLTAAVINEKDIIIK